MKAVQDVTTEFIQEIILLKQTNKKNNTEIQAKDSEKILIKILDEMEGSSVVDCKIEKVDHLVKMSNPKTMQEWNIQTI